MDALRHDLRIRFTTAFEWIVAAMFLCATVAVAFLILQALITPVRPVSISLGPAGAGRSPSVPAGAVSDSALPVAGGVLQLGASLPSTAALLGRAAETGRQEAEPGRFGERLIRFYERDGTRFVLVFEPLERGGDLRLTGIYTLR